MTKERISSDVDRKLRIEVDEKAEELGISRAKLIEIALKSELDISTSTKRTNGSQGNAIASKHKQKKPNPITTPVVRNLHSC